MVPGWAAHSANAGLAFGKAPGPRQVHALSGYAARDPVTIAGELHAIRGRSEGMSVRGRTMARGTAAFRKGGDLRPRLHGQGMDAGGRPEGGGPGTRQPRIFRTGGRARRAGAAGRSGGAVPARGGGSSQPCREWTMGSHSPDPRRAARRCSSRERGDWPRPAGSACTAGGSASRNPDRPPDIPFC